MPPHNATHSLRNTTQASHPRMLVRVYKLIFKLKFLEYESKKLIIDCLPDFEGNIIININVVSTSETQVSNSSLFSRITQAAYDKGIAQQVEDELRGACFSAPMLIKTIRMYEALGYLDTKSLSSSYLYQLLHEHFGLPFQPRCFRYYRSK